MTDILDLPGWSVAGTRTEGDMFVIEAAYTIQPDTCPKCGCVGNLYRHGTKPVSYVDSPVRGAPTKLIAKVQRYRCRDCTETFLQPLGGILADRRMTERCGDFIAYRCLSQTFIRIAEDVGCDDKTVRVLAGDFIAKLEANYQPALPEWLGIDETQIDGEMRCVITDVGNKQPIDMLKDRSKVSVINWLARYKDRSMVKGVATDMWRPYREVTHIMMPGIPLVVDKFHVVRMANYCMERVRIRLQKTRKAGVRRDWLQSKHILNMGSSRLSEKQRFNRDMWLDNEPELADAYRLKEVFYAIYQLPKDEAAAAFDAYAAQVPEGLKPDFKVLLTAMKNWRKEILAFFEYPITNAYTEALNRVAKEINRAGRGYSFDVLRARVLFGKRVKDKTWSLVSYMDTSTKAVAYYVAAAGNRCQCCGMEFGSGRDERPTITLLEREGEEKRLVMCKVCFGGFYTESLNHDETPSTR